ncbi:hypothetical protein LEMLEM_LOCUS19159, partial [Lemmus lemmus]
TWEAEVSGQVFSHLVACGVLIYHALWADIGLVVSACENKASSGCPRILMCMYARTHTFPRDCDGNHWSPRSAAVGSCLTTLPASSSIL